MPTDTRPNLTPQFLLGVGLVVFGGLLTLDRLQIIDAEVSFRFWPVVLIALGGWIVAERRETGRTLPGYAMIVGGGLLLLNNFGLVRVRVWELFWPIIIVLVGAHLIMRTRGSRWPLGPSQNGIASAPASGASGTISMFSVFGGTKRASNDRPFRGGEMTSIVGGTQLDLRQATIEPGQQAVIDVFAIMGGHEVWVPMGWTVISEVVPVLGNVEDKRLPPVDAGARLPSEAAPRLVLKGVVVLGGLIIKS
jgi:hypothetical protein